MTFYYKAGKLLNYCSTYINSENMNVSDSGTSYLSMVIMIQVRFTMLKDKKQ